jgi:hypothetical protein
MTTYEYASTTTTIAAIAPGSIATATTSDAIDISGAVAVSVIVATGATTTQTATFKITEGDTVSGIFTDVAAADIYGTIPAVAAQSAAGSVIVGYKGNKRYIKVVATPSAAMGISAIVVKSGCRYCPTDS